MEQSESIKELATALSTAQGELKNVAKSGKGNYGKYAELGPTLDDVRPVTSKYGLSVVQMPVLLEDGTTGLTTQLMHKSGEWIRSTFPLRMQQQTPQGQGSSITYGRRYALSAVLGIAGDDDDGQAGTEGKNPEPRRQTVAKPTTAPSKTSDEPELATPVQKRQIISYARSHGIADEGVKAFLRDAYGVPGELTRAQAERVLEEMSREGGK